MAINVHLNFLELIQTIKPDAIYFFNGRLAEIRPLIKLAERFKIPFYNYELAPGTYSKYILLENTNIHDQKYYHNKILEFWENCKLTDKESEGMKWFTHRRNRINQDGPVFILNQSKNKLPTNFNSGKRNIAIFNHSDDEFAASDGWKIPLFNDQNDAIRKIVKYFSFNNTIHFYLRMHPNLTKVKNAKVRELLNLNYKNITVIKPEDDIDTYALLDACDKIITFGSTVGVEATAWNKPSVFLGMSLYMDLDCTYIPNTIENVFELIENDLKPKDKLGALKYGFWVEHYGIDFIYYKAKGPEEGTFMGKKIELDPVMKKYDNLKVLIHKNWWGKSYRFMNKILFIPNILRRAEFYRLFFKICYNLSHTSFIKTKETI